MVERHRAWTAVAVLAAVAGCRTQQPAGETEIPEQPRAIEKSDAGSKLSSGGSSWKEAGESAPMGASAAPATAAQRTHVVKKGDTIYSLARLYYAGDIHKWHAIYDANRDRLPDPNTLKVGQVLVIP